MLEYLIMANRRSLKNRRRFRNAQPLVEVLAHALKGNKTMTVQEVTETARKSYKTTSKRHFRTIVNSALLNNPTRFKRLKRGVYRTIQRRRHSRSV